MTLTLKWDKECNHECIICGDKVNAFYPYGIQDAFFSKHMVVGGGYRNNSLCLHCLSIDRDRWQYYTIKNHTSILSEPCSVLHIAPENWLRGIICKNAKCEYTSGDIRPGVADLTIDLTNMHTISDSSFDYLIVNHVMEHIPDEISAFSEIKRVLKPTGKLILSFPVSIDTKTFEDSSADTDEKRLKLFGQKDHVRLYGSDYKEHVESFGFSVDVFTPEREMNDEQMDYYGFIRNDILMICGKTSQ